MILACTLSLAMLAILIWANMGNSPTGDWREMRNHRLSAQLDAEVAAYKLKHGRLPG